MNSDILRTATRYLLPLLVLFSLFLLLQGHNHPGGGFVSGLVASSAGALYALVYRPDRARALLRVQPQTLIGCGLFVALLSGVAGLLRGEPFLTGWWFATQGETVSPLSLGTPVLFDVGVDLVVIGVTLNVILTLLEE